MRPAKKRVPRGGLVLASEARGTRVVTGRVRRSETRPAIKRVPRANDADRVFQQPVLAAAN